MSPVPVLDVLRRAVRHVSIIGRRGPLQAAFSTKELRELTAPDGTSMLPLAPELLGPPTQQLALTLDASARAVPIGVTSVQHIVTALGHHDDPAAAYVDPGLSHLRTGGGGRVLGAEARTLRCVYASGWAATGGRRVLASTMLDDAVVADDTVDLESVPVEVEEGVRARRILQYDRWKMIDVEEVRRGAEMDKEQARQSVGVVIWHHISIWSYLYMLTKKSDCVFSVRPPTKAWYAEIIREFAQSQGNR
ncbi:hypothetical protein EDB83DRAFT_2518149 [Lactarius deliciosus]|nr:hypothetical protein EDB83DRAFT_2518149 [Lactarius deliciosus]